jgi:hypothetical protein
MASRKIACIEDGQYVGAASAQAASITNEAYVWAAIQLALMLAQRSVNTAISDMQQGLADRRMKLAEEVLAHAKKTWVKEKAFVDEMMAEAKNTATYGISQSMLNEMDRVETIAIDAIDDRLARFGIEVGACDDARTRRGLATARADLVSHSMRSEEARAEMLNARRYSRQLAAVALGRGTLQNAMSMGALSSAGDSVRGSLIRTINSGMSLWGYSANRWRHGGNYNTGENGAPRVVPKGYNLVETTSPTTGTVTLSVQNDSMTNTMTAGQPTTTEASSFFEGSN